MDLQNKQQLEFDLQFLLTKYKKRELKKIYIDTTQRRVNYQDFEPSTEWVREPDFDTLQVHIPGFSKEQVKVQVTSTRKLKIHGERPVKDNRVSRFSKEFSVPQNVDINKISANFISGTLYVKLPKGAAPAEPQVTIKPLPAETPRSQVTPPQAQEKQEDTTQAKQEEAAPKTGVDKQTSTKTNNSYKETHKEANMEKIREKMEFSDVIDKTNGKSDTAEISGPAKEKQHEVVTNEKTDASKGKDVAGKSKVDKYKKVIIGLTEELKKPRTLVNLAVAVSLIVVIGYNHFVTFKNPEN